MKYSKVVGFTFLIIAVLIVGCEDSSINPEQDLSSMGLEEMTLKNMKSELPEGLVYNMYNRNYYQAVEVADGITWEEANAAASGMSYGRCTSHLATLTSFNENLWVTENFPQAIEGGYWLGGKQAAGAPEPAGGWGWVTGENWLFANWAFGEPNDFFDPNDNFNEESLHFFPPAYGGGFFPGSWNDQNGESTGGITGYMVEYDCPTKVIGGGVSEFGTTYGFNSQRSTSTDVMGQAQTVFKPEGEEELAIHMEVTCQSVWGNDAWLGGIVVESDNTDEIPIGRTFLWRFEDNGEGQDVSDFASFFVFFGNDAPIDLFCDVQPTNPVFAAQFEIGKGNIKILDK